VSAEIDFISSIHKKIASVNTIKYAGIAIGMAYVIGVLIESISHSFLGLYQHDFIRARSIFVGFTYAIWLVYILSPIAFLHISSSIFENRKIRINIYIRGIVIAMVTYVGIGLMSSPIQYFVTVPRKYNLLTIGYQYYTALCLPGWMMILMFLTLHLPLAYISGFISSGAKVSKIKELRLIAYLMLVGILSTFVPYALHVYPNVAYSMGGGQPNLIYISAQKLDKIGISGVLKPEGPWLIDSDGFVGPFICWK
tara:strand:- start:258 stop:1016 length:759 start_codon:yes stop_codon:yes gene_type:complete